VITDNQAVTLSYCSQILLKAGGPNIRLTRGVPSAGSLGGGGVSGGTKQPP